MANGNLGDLIQPQSPTIEALPRGGTVPRVELDPEPQVGTDSRLESQWLTFLKRPEVIAALTQFTINAVQPTAPGQTTAGKLASSVAAGGRAAGRVTKTREGREDVAAEQELASRRVGVSQEAVDVQRQQVQVAKQRIASDEKRAKAQIASRESIAAGSAEDKRLESAVRIAFEDYRARLDAHLEGSLLGNIPEGTPFPQRPNRSQINEIFEMLTTVPEIGEEAPTAGRTPPTPEPEVSASKGDIASILADLRSPDAATVQAAAQRHAQLSKEQQAEVISELLTGAEEAELGPATVAPEREAGASKTKLAAMAQRLFREGKTLAEIQTIVGEAAEARGIEITSKEIAKAVKLQERRTTARSRSKAK